MWNCNPPPKKIRSFVGSGWYAALYTRSCVTFALATIFMPCSFPLSSSTSLSCLLLPLSKTYASTSPICLGYLIWSNPLNVFRREFRSPGSDSGTSVGKSSSSWRGRLASRARSSASSLSSSSILLLFSSSSYEIRVVEINAVLT